MSVATTLARLEARRVKLEAAYDAALNAQQYSIAGRSKTMATLDSISKELKEVEARIDALTNGGGRSVEARFTPYGS